MNLSRHSVAIALTAAIWGGTPHAQKPSLEDVLKKGTQYVTAYAPRVSGVTLDELFLLIEVGGGRMAPPSRISSDVVLINVNSGLVALRDVYAIDTKPVRTREPRITSILTNPTVSGWQVAQSYAQQNQIYLRANVIVQVSEPTQVLQFLTDAMHDKVTYKLEGQKRIDGVQTIALSFKEPTARDKVYVLGTRGNAASSGRFWLDPATGAVHQTEFWIESPSESARLTTVYARDTKLDLLLPASMHGTYQWREASHGPTNMGVGVYNLRQDFEVNVKYSNPTLTPIDLTKIR